MPAPTGKVTICAAKTKTATSPASGAERSVELVAGRAHQAGRDDTRRRRPPCRPRSGRRGSRRGRARAAPCRSEVSCCTLFATRATSNQPAPPPTSESPAGACAGRVTRGARSPCTVLLASSTIRLLGEVHGGQRPGVDPHPLQPGQPGADRLGDDRLDRVAVAHGHPHGVRAVLGLDLGVEGTHAADDPGGHLRERLRRVHGIRREGRGAGVVLHDPPQRLLGRLGEREPGPRRRSGTPPAGRPARRRGRPGPRMPSRGTAAAGWRRRGRW